MVNMKQKKWWESSVDAGKMSMRLRGALVALVPIILFIAQSSGLEIGQDGVMYMIDIVVNLFSAVALAWGVVTSIMGHMRRK